MTEINGWREKYGIKYNKYDTVSTIRVFGFNLPNEGYGLTTFEPPEIMGLGKWRSQRKKTNIWLQELLDEKEKRETPLQRFSRQDLDDDDDDDGDNDGKLNLLEALFEAYSFDHRGLSPLD